VDGGATLNLTNASGINATDINVTLGADTANNVSGQGNLTGPLTLGVGSLTKNGSENWTIAATNIYTGKTVINGGTLTILAPTALGPVTTFTPDYVTLNGGSLAVTSNITFTDGFGGFTASGGAGGFNVGAGATLIISNEIAGAGTLTKSGTGTLILSGSNSFTGTLNVDSSINVGSDGSLRVASSNAISGVLSPIVFRNNNGGVSTFELDGSNGNILVTQNVAMSGRSSTIPALVNIAGSNTLAGTLRSTGGGGQYRIESDSGLLTLSGSVSNIAVETVTFTFQGNGNISVPGLVEDGVNTVSLVKEGTGSLFLNGTNTYTGQTTVSGGTLGGTGIISGPISVASGGTLSPGSSIGTLTINNSLTLAGNTFIEINKTAATRDQILGLTSVNYGGTLTVSNLSGTLAANDSFQIFPATTFTGNFTSIAPSPGGGLSWNFNPTNGMLSVVSDIPNTPTNITFSVSGNTLNLNWPANYLGWILQNQTNSLNVGLNTNWTDMPGSASVTSTNITIIPVNPTVFFRLRHP
jgi:autotransporter-associated beta strand protein